MKGEGRKRKEKQIQGGLSKIADVVEGVGGNRLAAGERIEKEKEEELRQSFNELVREEVGDTTLTPSLTLDEKLDFSKASDSTFLRELELLQPFGPGNAEPSFASPPLLIKDYKNFGYTKEHVLLEVFDEESGITLHAKAWRKAHEFPSNIKGKYIVLAYTPLISTYNGVESVEIRIKDWKFQ